jgi:putative endonuclease
VDAAKPPTEAQRGLARRRTGVRGETFAYWYLRRHGYTIVARNFTATGYKGEIDLIGYDGSVLAFVEVKTRTGDSAKENVPEDAVTADKRHHLTSFCRSAACVTLCGDLTSWQSSRNPAGDRRCVCTRERSLGGRLHVAPFTCRPLFRNPSNE